MDSNISTKNGSREKMRWFLPTCQSTQDSLRGLLEAEGETLPEGFRVVAGFQESGRGQRGAVWFSEPGQNLLLSFFYRPEGVPPAYAFWISAAAALALTEVLGRYVSGVQIKWPNDVLAGGRKLAGILTEIQSAGGSVQCSLTGIGLNVNAENPFPGATSLKKETGHTHDLQQLEDELAGALDRAMEQLRNRGWAWIRNAYLGQLAGLGLYATYALNGQGGELFRAMLKTVAPSGRLVLHTSRGEQVYDVKEIRLCNPEAGT